MCVLTLVAVLYYCRFPVDIFKPGKSPPVHIDAPAREDDVPAGTTGWTLASSTPDQHDLPHSSIIFKLTGVNGDTVLLKSASGIYSPDDASVLQGIDPSTFVAVGYSDQDYLLYGKDQAHCYWFTGRDWGVVQQCQPGSFNSDIGLLPYARDGKNIFYIDRTVDEAEPTSFVSIPGSGYSKDSAHVFSHFGYGSIVRIVDGADPATFTPYPATRDSTGLEISDYGRDAVAVYCQDQRLEGADTATFAPISSAEAKDATNSYSGCERINAFDAP